VSDAEALEFNAVFMALKGTFRLRGERAETDLVRDSYFKALRRYTLQQVRAGADAWTQRGKFFPKPAEWIEAIPRRQIGADMFAMSAEQAHEWRRAEALRWEDRPCLCHACKTAGVSEKPLRFVPEFTEDDRDRKVKLDDRIVTAGHWAHGDELARWYQAKGDFYEKFYALCAEKSAR
jgi:hypothetical protein